MLPENLRIPPEGFDPTGINPPPLLAGRRVITALALDVSGACNLACRYCSEELYQQKRPMMSVETMKAACDLLFSQKAERYSIHLGSGEPLLNLPLLREMEAYLLGYRLSGGETPKVTVYLTSNAWLLTEPIMDWLAETGWNIKISMDGPAEIHNRWRVLRGGAATHERALKAVQYLNARIPERLAVDSVLCRGVDFAEVFDFSARLGVRRLEMIAVAHTDPAVRLTMEDVASYRTFIHDYARRLEEAPAGTLPEISRFRIYVMRLMGYQLGRAFCGAGRVYISIGADGAIYPCARFIGHAQFRTGTLETGVDQTLLADFCAHSGRAYEQREKCASCWAAPLCAGPCFAFAEMVNPGTGEQDDAGCAFALATAEAAISFVNRARKDNPERLLPFLPFETGFLNADF